VIMVFFGEARWEDRSEENGAHGDLKPHESPLTMTIPLVVLAGLTIFGGLIQLPSFGWIPDGTEHQLEHWTEPVLEFAEAGIEGSWALGHQELLIVIAVASGLLGIVLAWLVYSRKRLKALEPKILADAWNYDSTVSAFMGGPGRKAFDAIAWFDKHVIDGAVNGAAKVVTSSAGQIRKGQTGNVRNYAAIIGLGVVLLMAWFVIGRGVL